MGVIPCSAVASSGRGRRGRFSPVVLMFLVLFLAAASSVALFGEAANVTYDHRAVVINGQRRVLVSGSIHYPRSTPEMWPDLIQKSKDGGLDVIETYVFWNLHEPVQNQYNFEGRNDLVKFVKTVAAAGLLVHLRIGPYVCAEWNYGGFPLWLHFIPGIKFRTDNEPFKREMQRFTTKIVDMMKQEKLFASQGGPIILAQIENEYGNVESSYGSAGKQYASWSASMALSLNTGVPWVMCNQPDAPVPIINTCNGFYCDQFSPNSANKPKIWTENWSGWFQSFGSSAPHRPAEDLAFAVARFYQRGGTFQNYYMYHGGTNFGHTTGGPFITTSYDYDAPIDEYGVIRQPKWGHLRDLHKAIKLCEGALIATDPTYSSLGTNLEAHVYRTETGACAAFLANIDSRSNAVVTFNGNSYNLPAWSVSILPDCKTVVFNTAQVNSQVANMETIYMKSPLEASRVIDSSNIFQSDWSWIREPVGISKSNAFTKNGLLEQISTTADSSDYLWYSISMTINGDEPFLMNKTQTVLHVESMRHILYVYVNGHLAGTESGSDKVTLENTISLTPGTNRIDLLSATVGLQNYGAFYDEWGAGITGPVKLKGNSGTIDLSSNMWTYQVGLKGEDLGLYKGSDEVSPPWSPSSTLPTNTPFVWYKGIAYKTAKKKKGMAVGFVGFSDLDMVKTATQELNGKSISGKNIQVSEVNHRFSEKKVLITSSNDQRNLLSAENQSKKDLSVPTNSLDNDAAEEDNCFTECPMTKARSARDVATPLANMPYSEQLEHKKNSLLQTLKRLTRNARKACPDGIPLPDWIFNAREIGGLPCKLEGILESPMTSGYRNKCEFSVGYSLEGKKTVGFMLGNFREGMTAVMEPIDCPNVSHISCKYALIFQEFLQSSDLPVWNRVDNVGFWRQFTVREGRKPNEGTVVENVKADIIEVMLIVQVCTLGIDNNVINSEFKKMSEALARGAADYSPPLPLTSLVVQDHTGISNAAPADCPLLPLPIPEVGKNLGSENQEAPEARIHDYINNLRFSISPTAFFQVNTLAAEKLYSLAGDWANLSSDTLLFDVCCGTGTIGLTLAHHVGMVVGIEMNDSAVSDAQRNAEINGIKNCRFVCGKAEDVMGALLKEYLDMPLEENSELDISEDNEVKSGTGDVQVTGATDRHLDECSNHGGQSTNQNQHNDDSASISGEILGKPSDDASQLSCTAEDKKEANAVSPWKFRNVVAIVDPPRGGLHPNVIKTIRTHPRLRHLVYISCNPESLVANAIELCTPTSDKPQKRKANRVWRNATSASLARHRTKSMPNSEPFRPVKAMAVDLFPHTPHCEMVMLLER